jgi:hypothetical protein
MLSKEKMVFKAFLNCNIFAIYKWLLHDYKYL